MLSLGNINSLSHTGRIQHDPEQIARINDLSTTKLVAWYDFTDGDTMFTNTAGTIKAGNGDRIQNVTNKAYDGLGASSTSLNINIQQPSATTSLQPIWTAPVYTSSGITAGYLNFVGTEFLQSTTLIGNVSTGKMGGVILNHQNHTISFAIKNSNITDTNDHFYFGYQNAGRRVAAIGLESTDDQMHYWPEYSGQDIDSNTAFTTGVEYWTIVMGVASTTGAGVSSIQIYRNGVLVDADPRSFAAYNKDLTANHSNVLFTFGSSPGSLNQYKGRIYEYAQYDKALSDHQLDQLHRYYGSKYKVL